MELEVWVKGEIIPTLCVRCGRSSYHLRKSRYARFRKFNWSEKSLCRKTTGSGRMQYLCGFREGIQEWILGIIDDQTP
ncbi:hypothetical protein MKW94_023083 [Papaver nudicaule]|uniref:Uncharacterized protein n=1 Tax=Papaver nudicaule TaxID=74823 RepID=A0AA41S075_PAPNU|nr:hypothetical protein [Papaver nudicaule]